MAQAEHPTTNGVRALRQAGIAFIPRLYRYEEHGGTSRAAAQLGVPEHQIVKTLVMQSDLRQTFLVLMHGDCEVSTKQLARGLNVKTVNPCDRRTAEKITGYTVGGISPFGTRQSLPVYVESSILQSTRIYINAGKRGFLAEINPHDLGRAFDVQTISAAIHRAVPEHR